MALTAWSDLLYLFSYVQVSVEMHIMNFFSPKMYISGDEIEI